MYQLYEKVPKTKEYMQGSKPVEEGRNPFSEGPCFLCVAAAEKVDKSVFGVTKQGMRMARLRVRGEQNSGFYINDFPVKFLSMKLNTRDEDGFIIEKDRLQNFVNTYLLPLISNNKQRIDCNQAMRQMRNVNILSYCDGTITVQNIEQYLIKLMQQLGYTSEEIDRIQSQMCMFPIATNRVNGQQKSTCISFKDINDDEVNDDIMPEIRDKIESSPIKEGILKYSNNELAYYMCSNGAHTIKAYTKMGRALPACLSSVISKALNNSLNNSDSTKEFIPVTAQLLTEDCMSIMQAAEQGISLEEILDILDQGLKYGTARRLSKFEIQLLDQIDESYDNQIRIRKEREYLRKTDQAIGEMCSDVTRLKILAARGYQLRQEESEIIANLPSDRDILGSRESTLTIMDEHAKKAGKLIETMMMAQDLDEQIVTLEGQKEK